MKTISILLYFLNHHCLWSYLIFIILGTTLSVVARKFIFVIIAIVLGFVNCFTAEFLSAWFLNKFGTKGTAIITQAKQTNSTLNERYIYDYDAIVKTPNGGDVKTAFSTMTAAIYPIRNSIYVPPVNEVFYVKYIPGYEKNVVILSDESPYGRNRVISEKLEPVNKARIQYEASPKNKDFKQEYIQALKAFIKDDINALDSATIKAYKETLSQLENGSF